MYYTWVLTSDPVENRVAISWVEAWNEKHSGDSQAAQIRRNWADVKAGDTLVVVCHGHPDGDEIGPERSTGGDAYGPEDFVKAVNLNLQKHGVSLAAGTDINLCFAGCYTDTFASLCDSAPSNHNFVCSGEPGVFEFGPGYRPDPS